MPTTVARCILCKRLVREINWDEKGYRWLCDDCLDPEAARKKKAAEIRVWERARRSVP